MHPVTVVAGIVERKRNGIDCTEDESCVVKRHFDDLCARIQAEGNEPCAVVEQADPETVELFPLEWAEWCEDRQAGRR